jgi:predicted nucleic acid-binding protein
VSPNFTALLDACVLYPAPLRDLLMSLATADLFRARWSADIHEEWIHAVLKRNADKPHVTRNRLERTRQLMDENVLDAVVTGYEKLIEGLTLPDPGDRHVLAAAIRAGADVIVTFNLKDFPESVLAEFGIHAQHPDGFIGDLLDLDPGAVCGAAKQHRARLKSPPVGVEEYLEALQRQELLQAVARLRGFVHLL